MKNFIKIVLNFFRYFGKLITLIRNTVFNLLFLCLCVLFLLSFFFVDPQGKAPVRSDSILRLDISGNIVEQKRILSTFERFFDDPFLGDAKEPETSLQDILDVIKTATTDDNIKVLLLNLKDMERAGLNQLATIGDALNDFKLTGKVVLAAEDYYTQSQYFLASYATTIALNPMGVVDIHGMGVYHLYFKEAIDKLKVNYNIFKVGSYKSALEPFTRTSMSAEDKHQTELWLSALWAIFTDKVTTNRNIKPDQLQSYTNNISESLSAAHGNTSLMARNFGLVDQIWTREQVRKHLLSLTDTKSKKPRIIPMADYFRFVTPSYLHSDSDHRVGIIIAEGTILPGKQPSGMIGGDSLMRQIKKARENAKIKALVLRVNSGGGSAFASEIIRQELLEFKKTGKPLVISMGSVAASGGYWIAADGDLIWAQESTITGSIGIFGAIPTFEESLASLGVYSDGVGTTPLAAGLNFTQPLPQPLKAAIQQTVEHSYDKFLKIVSKGRGIPSRKVAEIAKGRVYDGKIAKSLGLIDRIGGLQNAIDSAAALAKLIDFEAQYIQPQRSMKDQIFNYIATNFKLRAVIKDYLPSSNIQAVLAKHIEPFAFLRDPKGIYAYCQLNPRF